MTSAPRVAAVVAAALIARTFVTAAVINATVDFSAIVRTIADGYRGCHFDPGALLQLTSRAGCAHHLHWLCARWPNHDSSGHSLFCRNCRVLEPSAGLLL